MGRFWREVADIVSADLAGFDRIWHVRIMPEGMHSGWQTSGNVRVRLLAINLWNRYNDDARKDKRSP